MRAGGPPPGSERVLITKPAGNPPAADAPTNPAAPTQKPTALVLLRRDGQSWKVSMTAPIGSVRAREAVEPARPGDAPEQAARALDERVGDLSIRDILATALTSPKTFGDAGMLDVYAPMTDGFKAFLKQRTGKDPSHPHADLTFAFEGPGKVYLLNPEEPTVADLGELTDQQLWDAMVEFAKKK
jgi:hypothetical protein